MLTFRGLLESREKEGLTELYSTFIRMEKHAEGSWLSLLGADPFSSYTGIPHIRGVERNVDEAVPEKIKEKFNSTEIFILLASILCHDVGKKVEDKYTYSNEHGHLSSIYILENWYHLLIPREDLARGIAIVCCSHTWENPIQKNVCTYIANCQFKCVKDQLSYLDSGLDSDDGYVRLRWVAALLRLADEVDNQVRRAVPKGFVIPKDDKHPDRDPIDSWRRHITGIVFDTYGKCIRLRTPRYIDSEWLEGEKKYVRSDALVKINEVLEFWKEPLNEIGLDFEKAFLDVSLPYPVLLPAVDKSEFDKVTFTCEPVLNDDIFNRVETAIKNLSNAVIGKKDYFSWEALAEESNIANSELVRLAAQRLASLQKWDPSKRPYKRKTPLDVQISDAGWKMDFSNKSCALSIGEVKDTDRIIPSIDVLGDLLSPDVESVNRGFCARSTEKGAWLPPIIAIEGSSGDGKSTLSLQIASNLVRNDWACLYYSLEQKSEQVIEILKGYDYFINTEEDKAKVITCEDFKQRKWDELKSSPHLLLLPRLTPRPVNHNHSEDKDFFEVRYQEIQHSLAYICGEKDKGKPLKCFYILDSLTAFSNHPLTRSQIHRLFSLFRQYRIPLLITLERQRHWVNNNEEDHFNIARYLADILINLDSENMDGYFQQTIEVAKSRFSRRVLGKHLMKIKSTSQKLSGQFDSRTGIAIYPSIHLHLVNSRLNVDSIEENNLDVTNQPQGSKPMVNDTLKVKNQYFEGIDRTLLPICQMVDIKGETVPGFLASTCMVIHGVPGGHKFALAMNILMAIHPEKGDFGHKLIISLAEENEIQLDGVALFDKMQDPDNIRTHLKNTSKIQKRGSKISIQRFGRNKQDTTVTVINFRLGNIMPEEFLFILSEFLEENDKKSKEGKVKKIDSVLFSDTVQFRTCFPLLDKEKLFLPTLVDFIKIRNLTSIFIDVHDEDGHPNEALLASADCRLYISKKTGKTNCHKYIKERMDKKQKIFLTTIQVDNILGKSYDRNFRYIVAKPRMEDEFPVLYIDESQAKAKEYWCKNQTGSGGCVSTDIKNDVETNEQKDST